MKIFKEMDLSEFEFWSGAKDNAKMLTKEELDRLGHMFEELGISGETKINDTVWFDFEWCCEILGLDYDSYDDEIKR